MKLAEAPCFQLSAFAGIDCVVSVLPFRPYYPSVGRLCWDAGSSLLVRIIAGSGSGFRTRGQPAAGPSFSTDTCGSIGSAIA